MVRSCEALRCRIFQLCNERDISVTQLGRICGIKQSTLENITGGRNNSATVTTVKRICDGLNMDLPSFFDNDLFRNLEQEIY